MTDVAEKISQDRLKELLHYEPDNGRFYWRKRRGSAGAGREAGSEYVGRCEGRYRHIKIDGRTYNAHRLVFLYMAGEFPEQIIDHINGDGCDNRWGNLRLATNSQNQANYRVKRNNKAGYRGVSFSQKYQRYQAGIRVQGSFIWLGYYDSAKAASEAYEKGAEEHFGSFSWHKRDRAMLNAKEKP